MGQRDFRCENCGYLFDTEHPYYSEDFAMAHFPNLKLGISWCLHCNHISEYREAKILGLFSTQKLKLKEIYHIKDLVKKEYHGIKMNEMGGMTGFHIHRMIWHAIEARAKLEFGNNHGLSNTLRKLLEILPPLNAALSILSVSNTSSSVSLSDQIELGIYNNYSSTSFRDEVYEILKAGDYENKKFVLEVLSEA